MKLTLLFNIFIAATLLKDASIAEQVFTYNLAERLNPDDFLSADGWSGTEPLADLANWKASVGFGLLYTRNTDDGDNTIIRLNDEENFSYSVGPEDVMLSFEVEARTGTGFWQTAICNADGQDIIGIGGEFSAGDNKFFILNSGQRFFQDGADATGDAVHTLRLELDLLASTGSLFYDGVKIITNQALNIGNIKDAAGLLIRTNSRFRGVGKWTIKTSDQSPAGEFRIADLNVDPILELVTISWPAKADANYSVYSTDDLSNLKKGGAAVISIIDNDASDSNPVEGVISRTFAHPSISSPELFFSVHQN